MTHSLLIYWYISDHDIVVKSRRVFTQHVLQKLQLLKISKFVNTGDVSIVIDAFTSLHIDILSKFRFIIL